MHPPTPSAATPATGLLRVRADAPITEPATLTLGLGPPRSRGCTLHHVGQALSRSTSPAYARMHPRMSGAARHSLPALPRMRGFLGLLSSRREDMPAGLLGRRSLLVRVSTSSNSRSEALFFQAWVAGGARLRDRRGWDPLFCSVRGGVRWRGAASMPTWRLSDARGHLARGCIAIPAAHSPCLALFLLACSGDLGAYRKHLVSGHPRLPR